MAWLRRSGSGARCSRAVLPTAGRSRSTAACRQRSRELDRLAGQLARPGELDLERQVQLKIGTRLVRQWNDRTCHVTVLDRGYLFEDQRYASLSQIARTVTGTKWSGPRFFGLKQRARAGERPHG